ncbi:Probable inactive receptor kinase [Striga hermonthica]|uniref:Probable inactive receptor kinase n=1 Tax=Striga hermonthica TaxID=68872 RepID=A0A9N7RQS8_STRHE|nr:Probable inactive receptor kinase [Striga hermonthica]
MSHNHFPHYLLFSLLTLSLSAAAGDPSESLTSLPPDAVSLLAFKSEADLDNRLYYATNERFDYCQWLGVKCVQGRVVRYEVPGAGLRGTIDAASLGRLDQLRVLTLRNNSLFGPLPDLSALVNLKTVSLDHNFFSGAFPLSLVSLHRLMLLDLSYNNFTGTLPENLTALDRLGYLRLDSNRFSGPIPPLNQTALEVFNVSSNSLSGPVPPTPTLKKFTILSFSHNPRLCGEVLNKPCRNYPFFNSSGGDAASPSSPAPLLENAQSQQGLNDASLAAQKKRRKNVGMVLGLLTGTLILTAAVLSIVALIRKRREEKNEEIQPQINSKLETNFTEQTTYSSNANPEIPEPKKSKPIEQKRVMKSGNLVFCSGEEELYTLEQLMRASAELLGRGSIGTTYKAVMANQLIVTVKRLDACKTTVTSGEEFEQYMENVGVLRHPNLVSVRAYFQAQQERLIIYDYQPNGSLFNLIHGSKSTRAKPLHWTSCLKIAEDVAQGLAYIHQASKLVHGNLKSSNVLLGPDFEAQVTDYCLSALAGPTTPDSDPDSSCPGYRAPEIRKPPGRGPTAKSDVYAFGVLLLELLTGKAPEQQPYLAPPDVPDWVRAMRDDDDEDDVRLRMLVEVASICSLTSPEQRPTMWQVLKMITNVKEIMDDGGSRGGVPDGYS